MTMAPALQPDAFENRELRQTRPLILFVDDNESIRIVMKTYLEMQHFSVITAVNGLEGLRAFKSNGAIRVVVTDRNMPLMDGDTMIREILKIDPNMTFIIASSDIGSYSRAVQGRADISLSKPYAAKDLVNAVRAAL